MGDKKEAGGVVIALLGFAALTLAFKGTWSNVWNALLGHSGGTSAQPAASSGSPANTPGSGPKPVAPSTSKIGASAIVGAK